MKNNYKEILIRKYYSFSSEEIIEKKNLLELEIVNLLTQVKKPDSEDLQIWGLTFYFSENDKASKLNLALEKFISAFELNKNNFLACLYIAHCFQDIANYEDALKYYNLVNEKKLKEFQFWRYVKLIEQIGFCHYKLGQERKGRERFEEVLSHYKTQPKNKFGGLAKPSELLSCLNPADRIVQEIKEIETYLK